MKSLSKKPNNITLKEYINTTNIRRIAASRSKSKQKNEQRNQLNTAKITHQAPRQASQLQKSRDQLVKQIKIKLAQLIPSNRQLVPLLSMFDRLLELYSQQLNLERKQNQIAASLLSDCLNLSKKSANQKFPRQKNKQNVQSQLIPNKQDCNQQTNRRENLDSKKVKHQYSDSYSSNNEIPNINLLLVTNHDPHPQVQQQTKATLKDHFNENASFKGSLRHQNSFCEKLATNEPKQKPSLTSNLNQQLGSISCRNSQINFSIHSTIWNNISQTQTALSKFQEYKMKSKR